jgi:transposase
MLKVDQVHVLRHKVLVEGRSQRQVAKELGISRLTVKKYLSAAVPIRRESKPRSRPVWEKVHARLETLLTESAAWTAGKQQLTATRLHELLRAEGHHVGVTVVKEAVAEWRRQRREVYVPLTYRPGDLAEVDFFEVLIDLAGTRRKAWLFLLRLMYSGRDFAWIYERQDQISFLDGHVRAFAHFGGVPARLAYDNLKAAVVRILIGGERALTARFQALASHYLFEPCFCRPGEGHDKGGVEARGKALRRQSLVPIPAADSLEAINAALLERLDARAATPTIATPFAEEARVWRPAADPFQAADTTVVSVARRAIVRLGGVWYSVPSRWAGLDLIARISPTTITIVGPDGTAIRHPRKRFGERSIDYRHYLPVLARKPQAVRQVLPDLLRDLGSPFPLVWDRLLDAYGPREAARRFAKVLGALDTRGVTTIVPLLLQALATDAPLSLEALTTVATPTMAVPMPLRDIEVGSGCAADYDAWLAAVPA